ncbi:MAG TPA: hypothetical protein HA349_08825 [Methanotrichaceae archaeon]|nr:hypothetical protein [Methanotrichaceae archaeon]
MYTDTLIAILAFINALFMGWEAIADESDKRKATDLIYNVRNFHEYVLSIPKLYIKSLDRIFGDFWSVRRLFISWVISITSVSLVGLYSFFIQTKHDFWVTPPFDPSPILYLYAVVFIVNCIPDYVSLQETMYILHTEKLDSIKFLIMLLIFDIFLTAVIFILLSGLIIYYLFENQYTSFLGFLLEYSYECKPFFGVVSTLFISTFATSIWLYFFVLAMITSYVLGKSGVKLISILPRKKYPFITMGIYASLPFIIIYIMVNLVEII